MITQAFLFRCATRILQLQPERQESALPSPLRGKNQQPDLYAKQASVDHALIQRSQPNSHDWGGFFAFKGLPERVRSGHVVAGAELRVDPQCCLWVFVPKPRLDHMHRHACLQEV